MSRSYSCEALVLKRIKFAESDNYYTVFTRKFGLLRVLARGVRKINSRRAPYLDLFNHSILFLAKGRNADIITDVKPVTSFSRLKSDLSKVALTFKIAEITQRLMPEGESHPVVFNELLNSLKKMDAAPGVDGLQVQEKFCLFLIHELGYLPLNVSLAGKDLDYKLEEIMEKRISANGFISKLV